MTRVADAAGRQRVHGVMSTPAIRRKPRNRLKPMRKARSRTVPATRQRVHGVMATPAIRRKPRNRLKPMRKARSRTVPATRHLTRACSRPQTSNPRRPPQSSTRRPRRRQLYQCLRPVRLRPPRRCIRFMNSRSLSADGSIASSSDGKRAWMRSPQGTRCRSVSARHATSASTPEAVWLVRGARRASVTGASINATAQMGALKGSASRVAGSMTVRVTAEFAGWLRYRLLPWNGWDAVGVTLQRSRTQSAVGGEV